MWNPLASWESRSRAWRTTVIFFLVNVVLLVFAFIEFPLISGLWERGIAGVVPDFYDVVVRQFIAALGGMSPGSVAASGTVLTYLTAFCSLLTIHLPIAYGLGWLFDRLSKDRIWSLVCYGTAFLTLLGLHVLLYVLIHA